MKRFIIFIMIIVAIIGIAGFYFYQSNIYSKETLKLEILGPEEVELLEEVEYIVKYKNNGNTRLEEPELIFEYPENSLIPEGESPVIIKTSEDFGGAIYPGEEKTFHFKTRLLGKEGDVLTAKANLSYRPKNIKPRYESATTFSSVVRKTSITFEFDFNLSSQIKPEKEVKFGLNYYSIVDYPLTNLRAVVEYPSGFEFIESNPQSLDKTEWDIGLLNKNDGSRIEILGKIGGEVGEEKIFKAKLGVWQNGKFIVLKETTKGIELSKSSLYVYQKINGNPKHIALPGEILHYEIDFQNTGKDLLTNLTLIVKLEGKPFNLETIKTSQGTFSLGDNSIVFDWKKVPKLQFLDANEEGQVEFWIELKEEWPISSAEDKNPVIKSIIHLNKTTEEFVNKVNSKLILYQRGYFEDEVFGNSGPIPPKVGETTTYTIMWQIKNFFNDVDDVKVRVNLPKNIELTGRIFPEEQSSKFAFDSQSREIVWEVGDLKMSQGTSGTSAPNISFQIRFTPSSDQKGKTPDIISEAEIIGKDTWTNETIEALAPAINTTLPDDQSITSKMGKVQ